MRRTSFASDATFAAFGDEDDDEPLMGSGSGRSRSDGSADCTDPFKNVLSREDAN